MTELPDTIVIALEVDDPELKDRLVDLIGAIRGVRLVQRAGCGCGARPPQPSAPPDPDAALAPRERGCWRLMAEGASNKMITRSASRCTPPNSMLAL